MQVIRLVQTLCRRGASLESRTGNLKGPKRLQESADLGSRVISITADSAVDSRLTGPIPTLALGLSSASGTFEDSGPLGPQVPVCITRGFWQDTSYASRPADAREDLRPALTAWSIGVHMVLGFKALGFPV